ncbi:conserved hypothetical protein [Hymenobacter roseosalivarius DSM 11622]|uniref:Sulfatase-modifying factor enzyme domain-containing protein n=1 Tax=Hymenobacter roseosalivarius DSM 11622 TaxID=645990 RepID=A0A1W1W2U8_9BACT|nr:hypothetical protein [Hymenobacter roseosalivarius]SMB99935.1 conserved hypothetical protein [Hymenobacter roseosalivarius DSM 11622]
MYFLLQAFRPGRLLKLGTSWLVLAACSSREVPASALPVIGPDSTVRAAAGPQYQRGAVHRFFWGEHYRREWATPVEAPVFNLRTAVPGGLRPLQAGGSFQTKNLRLVDGAGQEYVLRSVDKDATKALPAKLQNGPIGRLMKDQTSVIQPYGAYIVPRLAQAAGVYHTNPRLVWLTAEPALGEFREEFGNALYLFEERPDGNQINNPNFGHSSLVESSRKAFTSLFTTHNYRVDARHYLRARLFDMWLGDWSRREDQWRWASFPGPGGTVTYRAIPRDRDHAFFKFDDGVMTRVISWFKANYQTFKENIRLQDVEGLNKAARPMDKSLLAYLSAEDFRQIADSLRLRLTDGAIKEAVGVWPPQIYALSGADFEHKLRNRREQLSAVAAKFYELLARDVELPGTDQAERFLIEAVAPGEVRISLLARRVAMADSLLNQRTFKAGETRTIKLFGLGGNDVFEFSGLPDPDFAISIYDGAGQDLLITEKAPQPDSDTDVTIYDSGDGNLLQLPADSKIKVEAYLPLANEFDAAGWLLRHRLY